MDATDSIVFWEGFNTMDSLCQAKYIPAMYEIASTYGWYDNKRFKQRKKMLNIEINELGQPTSIRSNALAVNLYLEILEQGDTNFAYYNGRSAYMLASYAGFDTIYTKKDTALAKKYIEQGVRWASVNNDTVFINKLSDMKNKLNKKGKK